VFNNISFEHIYSTDPEEAMSVPLVVFIFMHLLLKPKHANSLKNLSSSSRTRDVRTRTSTRCMTDHTTGNADVHVRFRWTYRGDLWPVLHVTWVKRSVSWTISSFQKLMKHSSWPTIRAVDTFADLTRATCYGFNGMMKCFTNSYGRRKLHHW